VASLNNVNLIGYLGRDPELKYIQSGNAVCNFNLAITEKYNSESKGKVETTTWIRVVVWNKLAENCNTFLKKGSLVYVNGKIRSNNYDTKDGKTDKDIKVYAYEIVANNVQFLDRNGNSRQEDGEPEKQSSKNELPVEDFSKTDDFSADDDIPF